MEKHKAALLTELEARIKQLREAAAKRDAEKEQEGSKDEDRTCQR